MLFGVLLILLVWAALWINLIWGLFRILFFFLMISILWFSVKAWFYVLFFFAVVYFWIKWLIYISGLLSNYLNWKSHKKYSRVPYWDAEIIEMLE